MSIDITSWELTKELQELSGWEPDASNKQLQQVGFSLGYLLRKLPGAIVGTNPDGSGKALYSHFADDNRMYEKRADTPQDAVAKLAIELFKSGILK